MLVEIDSTNADRAVDLLASGMARRSRAFWETGLERLRQFGGNAAAGVPVGQLLMVEGRTVGVVLTPASLRVSASGVAQPVINLSSWYIEPEHRWRAPLMLRAVLRNPAAVFIDLTPTAQVQRMLEAMGFTALNDGEGIVALPVAALAQHNGAHVAALTHVPAGAIEPATRALLEAHAPFGCLAVGLNDGDAWHPLLFKRRTLRGLPAAQLVYCQSNRAFGRHLGAVARHLLRRGRLLLVMDIPFAGSVPGLQRRHVGRKFAKSPPGGLSADRTDYAGSELSLFDL